LLSALTTAAGSAEEYRVDENASGGYLNIRNGPGVGHQVVGRIPAGTNGVEVTDCESPDDNGRSTKLWCEVEWSGHSGWASTCCMSPVTVDGGFLTPDSIEADDGSDAAAATDCDRLAARPMMGDTPPEISGILFDQIDVQSAIAACRRAISEHPQAARFYFELGRALQASHDYPTALAYYKKAADAGERAAMTNLGYLYQFGLGVSVDYAAARNLYEQAAALGDPPAMTGLGYLYATGAGVPQDYSKAIPWYERAANESEPIAVVNLGRLYEHGRGVPQDYAQARVWYQKALGLGYTAATDDLARVSQEEAAAASSAQKAAANGSSKAAAEPRQSAGSGDDNAAGSDESGDSGSDNQADGNSGSDGNTDSDDGMCSPNRIGPEASRSDPIPSGADGTWTIVCDEDGDANIRTYYGGAQDQSASTIEDWCGSSNVLLELGGCSGNGGNVGVAWPKSMTLREAAEAKQVWMACPSGDPYSGNYVASLHRAAEQAKRICSIKSGCECGP
jgi:TPR repeat protein